MNSGRGGRWEGASRGRDEGGGTGFGWKGEVQKGIGWGNRRWAEGGGTERDGVGEQEVGGRRRYRKGWVGVVRIAMKRDKKGR